MNNVVIIGAGNLGTSLGYALSRKGYTIRALTCRSLSSVRKSRRIIRQGEALTDNILAASRGKLIFICVPDNEIPSVGAELASSELEWKDRYVYHCSGLLPAALLDKLEEKGALTGTFHPAQSFSSRKADDKLFRGIFFALEGNEKAVDRACKIASELGGSPLVLRAEDKVLYHLACSLASNFFVVLLDMASSLLESAGIAPGQATSLLTPLVEGTLQNVKDFDIRGALTGPVVRGDTESVRSHLEALKKFPKLSELYRRLALYALNITEERKIPSKKIKALRKLLEGK
ncbi:MAG: Rossmann-like and DUF2520 domain-containing protein [Candidatus Aminicenantales bacterium]